jgi:hypothetical protein
MGQVRTNKTSFNASRETALGTAGTSWTVVEPNDVPEFGPTITNTARDPISTDRQRRKGSTTDLDSAFTAECDLTVSHFEEFAEAFWFANWQESGGTGVAQFTPTAVVDGGGLEDSFTVAADGDVQDGTLIYARGFGDSGNNGLFVTTGTSTTTAIKVATGTLTADGSPAAGAEVMVAGFQGASGDLQIDASGDLISTVADFTTMGLTVGQFLKIGGTATDTSFANVAANNDYARVTVIAANKLTLDKRGGTFATDNGSGKTIQVFFSRFLRQYDCDNAQFLERSYTFEAKWDNMDPGDADHYEYPKGNYANLLTVSVPTADKASMTMAFLGTDTEVPTTSRKSGASSSLAQNKVAQFNTAADVVKLRILETDETALDVPVKSLEFTLNNNVGREKAVGTLGALYMNYGSSHPGVAFEVMMNDSALITALRNNRTLTVDWAMENDDGALYFDLPAVDVDGGSRSLPIGETVTISGDLTGHKDTTLGYSAGVSQFAHIPR